VTDDFFFETERLRVRPMRLSDVDTFAAYRADPDVARYQSWEDFTLEQGRELVESMQDQRPGTPGEWYQFALEDKTSGDLVGDLAACVDADEPRVMEVGFTLDPRHQGRGYGTEALRGLLAYAFGTWSLHRVFAVTDADNTAAAALLERLGFRQEAHFRENIFFKGSWGSELVFAMLHREWQAIHHIV
jgi:RimJ/RimL family protein N-acetyltransferase